MDDRAIFEAALAETDPDARRRRVEVSCAGDPDLMARVLRLLRQHEEAAATQEAPPGPSAGPTGPITPIIPTGAAENDPDDDPGIDVIGLLRPGDSPGVLGMIDHYEVTELVGRGGFGSVFKAFDSKLHRTVAVKMLSPVLAATSPPRKRFLREARAAAAIRHENVVQVHTVGEQPLPYLVMEFIEGRTLHQHMNATGPLEVREVLEIGRQVASGLAAAHEKGLIHRDIKPGNILLERGPMPGWSVKLTDFGLARAADDACITQSGAIVGTPLYMAPEQARGERLDHRADLFSLGSVLYAMTAGHPAFRAPSAVAVLRRVAEDTPRPLSELIPESPGWLASIIARLMEKDPERRFQTASEVADLLGRCLDALRSGHPVPVGEAESPSPAPAGPEFAEPEHAPEAPRSRPGRRRISSAAALVLLVALAGLYTLIRPAGEGDPVGPAPAPPSPLSSTPAVAGIALPPGDVQTTAGPPTPPPPVADLPPSLAEAEPTSRGDRSYFQAVMDLGGTVTYYEFPEFSSSATRAASRLIGNAYLLEDVTKLDDTPLLMSAPQVHLVFSGASFDDERLESVGRLLRARPPGSQPVNLQLNSTSVTPERLAALWGVTFYSLSIDQTPLADAGIETLRSLQIQTQVLLGSAGLGDDGLARLMDGSGIASLVVGDDRLSGRGLRSLSGSKLSHLNVTRVNLSDDDLEPISELVGLTTLVLIGNPITDAGLAHLEPLSGLTTLHLMQTDVTAEGVERLSRALPNCEIAWDGGTIKPQGRADQSDPQLAGEGR